MEINEDTVKQFMEELKKTDPIMAYIIGEMGKALKNHEHRISAQESQQDTPSNWAKKL